MWSPFFSLSVTYSARPFQTMMRCHSVFSWRCSFASVHHDFVARERMASLRPDFLVVLLSGFFPKKPISSTRFFMWNRAGSPARRIVGFGPRGGRTQNGGTNGHGVFDL